MKQELRIYWIWFLLDTIIAATLCLTRVSTLAPLSIILVLTLPPYPSMKQSAMLLKYFIVGDMFTNLIHHWWECKRAQPSVWVSGGSDSKESTCNAGDPHSVPEWGRPPGGRNGYPLQHSCLETSMDRRSWQATAHGVANSRTRLSN